MSAKSKPRTSKLVSSLQSALRRRMAQVFGVQGRVVLGHDIEAVHSMRVASRRLQEVIVLATHLTGQKVPPDGFAEIRRVRRALGRVRDHDVLLDYLKTHRQEGEPGDAAHVGVLVKHFEARRAKQLRRMRKRLGKLNLPALYGRLEESLAKTVVPAFRERLARNGAAAGRATVVDETRERLAAREREFFQAAGVATDTGDEKDYHAARIAGKRCRYLLETADELKLGGFKPRIKQLRRIQKTLGDWHDLIIFEERLLDICCDRDFVRGHLETATASHRLLARNRATRAALLKTFGRQVRRRAATAAVKPCADRVPTAPPPEPEQASSPASAPPPIDRDAAVRRDPPSSRSLPAG